MTLDLASRCRELALRLASWPSVTRTAEEAYFAHRLVNEASGFHRIWREPIPGDALGRGNVFALRRGRQRRTIILTGHFDVVPVDSYGDLKPLAFEPARLIEPMIDRLRASGENPQALADLESGDFLPGRGLLDMKAGLAAGLTAIEAYDGNATIVFLAVADEEDRSAGMRAAAPLLQRLVGEENLDVALVINLDAISDQGDGSLGRVAAMGSIGKQLLTALIVGREAHACYPQDGINAAYLVAELVSEIELAPELAEVSGDEMAAAPATLQSRDLKPGYNVTTPGLAWAYWNTLQHRRSPQEVMNIAAGLARRAMARAANRLGRQIPVMTCEDLKRRLPPGDGTAILAEPEAAAAADYPERSRLATLQLWQASGLSGPAVILGFGSIPYPAVALDNPGIEKALAGVLAPLGIGTMRYFPGISDMSFLGRAGGTGDPANTPLAGIAFDMPEPAGFPAINLGPWGRDYHHWLERLHAPYAFEVLPDALLRVITTTAETD